MSNVVLQEIGGIPCLTIALPGGLMAWQERMTDSLVMLCETPQENQKVSICLFSLNSAQPQFVFDLSTEAWKKIVDASCIVFLPHDLKGDQAIEAAIIKNEKIDKTGFFLAGIRKQILGDCQGALENYSKATAVTPDLPRISNLQGLCYRMLNRMEEAEKAYLKETEISPEFPDAYCNLGILYLKTGRTSLAKTMFEKALERNPMYFNALLQLAKFILEHEGPEAKVLASIHHRMLTVYHDLPQVHEHIALAATKRNITLEEYYIRVKQDAGILNDPAVLNYIKKVEDLRLNGALLSALRGYSLMLAKTAKDSPLEKYLLNWVARNVEKISKLVPPIFGETLQNISKELLQNWPSLSNQEIKSTPIAITHTGRLTPEEFFEILLEEVMKDGQIKPEEMNIIFRMKNALRINETTHKAIFNHVSNKFQNSRFADDGKDFCPLELYKRLHMAVMRDGTIEASEKKLLQIAREAFDLLPEDIESLKLPQS